MCPAGTRLKTFHLRAITLPITLNAREHLLDPAGEIYVLDDQEAGVRADNARRVPLAIRANAGQDCVDVVLTSDFLATLEQTLGWHVVWMGVEG